MAVGKKSKKSARSRQVKRTKAARQKPLKSKRLTKQKIAKLPKAKLVKIPRAETRNLKQSWNFLRKLGLIQSRRDGRKIKANDKRAKKQIARYRDLLTGKAQAVKLPKEAAQKYKEAGEKVVGDIVIIKTKPGEKIKRKGKKIYKAKRVKGGTIRTILIPHSWADLQRNARLLEKDPEVVDLLDQGYKLGLRIGSDDTGFNYSYRYLPRNGRGIKGLFEDLRHYIWDRYETVRNGKIFGALELIAVTPEFTRPESKHKTFGKVSPTGRNVQRNTYSKKKYQQWRQRHPEAYERFKIYARERYRALKQSRKRGRKRRK